MRHWKLSVCINKFCSRCNYKIKRTILLIIKIRAWLNSKFFKSSLIPLEFLSLLIENLHTDTYVKKNLLNRWLHFQLKIIQIDPEICAFRRQNNPGRSVRLFGSRIRTVSELREKASQSVETLSFRHRSITGHYLLSTLYATLFHTAFVVSHPISLSPFPSLLHFARLATSVCLSPTSSREMQRNIIRSCYIGDEYCIFFYGIIKPMTWKCLCYRVALFVRLWD